MEIPNASRIPHPGTPQSLQHPADDHTFFCPTSIGIRYSRLSPCMFNGWIGMTVRHGTHTLRRQHTDVNTDLSEADTQSQQTMAAWVLQQVPRHWKHNQIMDILHRLDFVEPTITHSSPPELTKLGSSRPKRNDTKNLTHGEDQGSIDITAMQQAKKREQTWNIQELQPERSTQYQDKQVHTQQAFYINTTKPTQPHCSEHRSSRAIANSTQNTGRRQQRGKGADSPAPQAQKPLGESCDSCERLLTNHLCTLSRPLLQRRSVFT